MQTATVLKNKFSKKQILIVSGIVGGLLLITVGYFAFTFFFSSSARASEDAPQNVQVVATGANKVQIKWNTPKQVITAIEYGTEPDPTLFKTLAGSATPSSSHSIDISSLEPGATYFFQIRVGDKVFNNEDQFWTFTTPKKTSTETTATTEATLLSDGETSSDSAGIVPTPSVVSTDSAELDVTDICSSNNCRDIQKNLGLVCSTQDYVKCILINGTSDIDATNITPTTSSNTPTPTASSSVSTTLKNTCGITNIQANSCTSWSWDDTDNHGETCEETFPKYFVQCKSSSFNSSDTSVWYCNETKDSNLLTLPCASGPTIAPGQSVFCRIRAETEEGGSANATNWVYKNTTCTSYNSSNKTTCAIQYLQSANCKSWSWDIVNTQNATCKAAFSKYFFQCNSNGNFALLTTTPTPAYWYCNNTTTNNYMDFPCYNAPTPIELSSLTCRVRAEDAVGGDSNSTAWTSTTITCPTNTPTPTITPTP